MEVTHRLGNLSVSKTCHDVGFSLSNKKGSYCCFFENPSSKYQGLFYFDNKLMTMYKFIENIELDEGNDSSELANYLYFVERKKHNLTESFLMPAGYNSLLYELDDAGRINIMLDCRDVYDNRQWGRNYELIRLKDCAVVKFTKKTDHREDSTHGKEEFTLYLAIKADYDYYELNDKWVERNYWQDAQRKINPSKRYVYNALAMHGKRFVFSMARNMDQAVTECLSVFSRFEQLRKDEETYLSRVLSDSGAGHVLKRNDLSDELKVAYLNAVNSLNNLIVHDEFRPGILAGFPWFFQYWSRDSLVSLKSVYKLNHILSGKILYDYLNSINPQGKLFNLIGKEAEKGSGTADAHGWLFARCSDILHEIEKYRLLMNSVKRLTQSVRDKHDHSEIHDRVHRHLDDADILMAKRYEYWHHIKYEIETSLERSITRLHKLRTNDLLEYNGPKETWMDTSFEGDERAGCRIEIQAFRLNMYRMMFELTRNQTYTALESMLKSKVRQSFFDGKSLADGENDFTQRPNIYLAAYVYPNLLSKEEWSEVFSGNLGKIWLDWGGLSTIDKSNRLFCDTDQGEDIRAYHRGDSWFWVNNLAAITFHRINPEKFNDKINKILEASTQEILWHGVIGCHAEISDAKSLSARGCFNQSWSNAMYIELLDEMFKI